MLRQSQGPRRVFREHAECFLSIVGPLETNAHANFPMAENAAYQSMEIGEGKHSHIDMFVAHCACRVQCWDKVKDLDGSLENMLNVFSVLLVTRTLSYGTINGDN